MVDSNRLVNLVTDLNILGNLRSGCRHRLDDGTLYGRLHINDLEDNGEVRLGPGSVTAGKGDGPARRK